MALSAILLLSLSLSLQPKFTMANITLSSSLTTSENSSWPSPSGDFAFGFRQLNNSNLYLLAIWFNKIPDRTIVWHGESTNPVPEGSKVELKGSGLVLQDPEGLVLWEARPNTTVSYAAMLDTGNFVLADNSSGYIWESFKNPTDTILPTQVLDLGTKLSSRLTETNFSKGKFELHFSDGNLQLFPIAWPSGFQYKPYYSSETNNVNASESGYQLVFNESRGIYIVKGNGETVQLPGWSSRNYPPDYYHRATLGFDGVFAQYSHSRNSTDEQSWFSLRFIPSNICTDIMEDMGGGACGFNSYCSIQDGRPTCHCPPEYVFLDPNNRYGGCKPTFPQGCGLDDGSADPEEVYDFRELDSLNWPLSDYERLTPYNLTQCRISCLYDCSCAVAVFSGGDSCFKKRLPLSNGRSEARDFSRVLFKVRKGVGFTPPGYSDVRAKKEKRVLLKALLGSSALVNACFLLVASALMFRMRYKRKVKKQAPSSSKSAAHLRFFTYKEVEVATKRFKEELGRGSFGIVYKGILISDSGTVLIAVKRLEKLAQAGEREFRTEVGAIGKTHHKNLVRLLGYCDQGPQRLLVYEFMSNGALANFLFTFPKPDWHHRVKIALGIARGLLYLHEECDVPIIHCDIKPQNILLDDHHGARIADFGLAKLLLSDQSGTKTVIRGTKGYVAPEWFKNVPISAKVDIYSFGVVLLEIICCRRSVNLEDVGEETAILTDWAYDCYVRGRFDLLVDNDIVAMDDQQRLQKWVSIAIWCIQEDPARRPTSKLVMAMLEGFVEVPSLTPHSFSFGSSSESKAGSY
ncbi:hypothetical protein Tsubulata_041960 [Turnera subulata]|uniref:Receptor-like serine/threonine-protein kinase n=1 Tax=Turnera subulata TaxID=218843 RepID=A0A9Q0G351_9ROSI|nr:hypothetical protein Tsubulata_041960 [Turnera subulata]